MARGIDAEVINHCIESGQLYEDAKRHNCAFVGFESGTASGHLLQRKGILLDGQRAVDGANTIAAAQSET